MSLRINQDGIANKMDRKILLFENIGELKLNEFLVDIPTRDHAPPNNDTLGTVCL